MSRALVFLMVLATAGGLVLLARTGAPAPEPRAGAEIPERDAGEVQVTRGTRHTVPLDEIIGGGPPKDGIPAIDDPRFTKLPEYDSVLSDEGLGVALEVSGDARFYPYQILVWHEIVNDVVGEVPVAVTYCPLCYTGIVFDRRVAGAETTFGVSGKLWNSNLVMYDRATDSYWSQLTGEAIVGVRAGDKLNLLPADTLPLKVFRERYPRGRVLTTETGARRNYAQDPYGDYYRSGQPGIGLRQADPRFPPKTILLGLVVEDRAVAFLVESVLARGEVTALVGGTSLVAVADREGNTVQIFRAEAGRRERMPAIPVFWFSWAAAHPDTLIFPTGA